MLFSAGDLKNIKGLVQHIAEDGGVMVLPQDAALPGFNEVIRFEPRELVKFFEVRCCRHCTPCVPWLADCLPGASPCQLDRAARACTARCTNAVPGSGRVLLMRASGRLLGRNLLTASLRAAPADCRAASM